jgi:hypothetical protein
MTLIRRFSSIYFFLVCVLSQKIYAQVDDFNMRFEQEYAQLKQQEIALTPQKIYSFSKEHTQYLNTNIADLLNHQTSYYIARHSIYQSDIYYQNRRTSPTIAIQNVDFSSSILENNFQLIQTLHPLSFESIQVYQGYSISQLQSNSSQIALNYPIHPETRDSFGVRIKSIAAGGSADYSGLFQFALHRKKINYVLNVYGGQTFRYELGTTPRPWLTWQRTSNPFNGAGFGSWTKQTDTLVNTQPQVFLGIDNLINLKINQQNEWNFYLHLEGRQETNLGNTIQKGSNYLLSESNIAFNPMVLAYIQKVNYSESSPLFTQLNLALTYQHLTNHSDRRYDIQDELYRQHYEENKISLQARARKNFNARYILFYGSEASATFIKNDFHRDDAFTSFYDQPVSKFTSYIKFEKRQSADISWFMGAKGGFQNSSFRHPPFVPKSISNLRPHGEINLSWQRHICESSNYIINLFLRSKAPSLSEFNPILNQVYLIPNSNLKNETEFLFESHLYRKFEDKFEIRVSPYFRYSWNAIILKDNFGNPNEKLRFGLNEYFTQQYTNQSQISEGGAQLELKYNVSKRFLIYHQINFQHVWTTLDSSLFYLSLPLYGNFGVKFKSNKLFIHSWMHFNGGKTFTDSVRSQYVQFYAKENGSQKEFPAYFDINLGIRYQFIKNLSAQFYIENILNQYSLDFLSTLPNQGRRFRLQLLYSL